MTLWLIDDTFPSRSYSPFSLPFLELRLFQQALITTNLANSSNKKLSKRIFKSIRGEMQKRSQSALNFLDSRFRCSQVFLSKGYESDWHKSINLLKAIVINHFF
jgi:hypothetical protein